MKNKDVIMIAIKNIFCAKIKFFLTFLSICIGISSVMIITTISDIGSSVINEKLNSMGIDGLFVSNKYTDSVLSLEFIENLENIFDIEQIMPIVSSFGSFSSSRVNGQALVWGVDDSLYETLQISSLEGRCFTSNEVLYSQKVAIIDENLANDLYGRVNVIGKTITLQVEGSIADFEIIGVISNQKELIDSFLGENSFSFIYIPYTTMQIFTENEDITKIAIRSSGDLEELKSDLEFYFSKNKSLEGMFEIQNISSYIEVVGEIMLYLTLILSFVAGISMIVAGIGVMNIMLSSTIERKKEIGIYMALGARKIQVGKIFLAESIIICLFSGVLGAIIGLMTVFISTKTLNLPFFINLRYVILVELISFVCGIVSGIFPAIKASRLNPIDILRE
ncbi:MAG: ABC transporter permease [Clostridia bacterium]